MNISEVAQNKGHNFCYHHLRQIAHKMERKGKTSRSKDWFSKNQSSDKLLIYSSYVTFYYDLSIIRLKEFQNRKK